MLNLSSSDSELKLNQETILTIVSEVLKSIAEGTSKVAESKFVNEEVKIARRQAAIDHVKKIEEEKLEDDVCIQIRKKALKTNGGGRYFNYLMKVSLEYKGKLGSRKVIKVTSSNAFARAYAARDINEIFDNVNIEY